VQKKQTQLKKTVDSDFDGPYICRSGKEVKRHGKESSSEKGSRQEDDHEEDHQEEVTAASSSPARGSSSSRRMGSSTSNRFRPGSNLGLETKSETFPATGKVSLFIWLVIPGLYL
jgi:hypothetical protein